MDKFKAAIINFLKKETKLDDIQLEIPPKPEMGDYAFPCFSLSKEWKKSPNEISQELSIKFKSSHLISSVKVLGPYLNFFINKEKISQETIKDILKHEDKFGSSNLGKNKKLLLEHTSINPNASPHVGRARNAFIGDSLVRILRFQGYKVESHYFVNNVGKQIALLVLGAEGKKNINFNNLLDIYVEINKKLEKNPEIEKKAFELLNKLEKQDKEVKKKFERVVDICIEGQNKIFSELDINYDVFDYESKYLWSKETEKTLKRLEKTGKLFIDGYKRWVLDQKGYGLGMKVPVFVMTRADGTSLYPLRDITYNIEKLKKGENIVVLGEDQKLYEEQIVAALKELELKWPRVVHYSFILLQDGKMSTRKGNLVLLEDFMKEAVNKASEELKKRYDKADESVAKKIAYGAVKYGILKVSPEKNVIFDWEQALSFEGETSPYIQYAYARISSILKKDKINLKANIKLLTEKEETELIKLLSNFPETVTKATKELRPHLIASYLYALAHKFNEYYHIHQILKAEEKVKDARLLLISAVRQVLKNGLNLLGIGVLEKM
ncbi:arginine--tRNA ligase [Candidatus Woesearchaeota archaeon]|nr:arginine--tRNA ligase [Candidatus Woesearchaeota archaeon]MDP6648218.1 arginine--tRNA ligase [Candidatus Woesearchaeota archaeon]|tara:strand:- start:24463 stop:26121 length:1659 start_codon:yes stop_codon:yes gene_type:complete